MPQSPEQRLEALQKQLAAQKEKQDQIKAQIQKTKLQQQQKERKQHQQKCRIIGHTVLDMVKNNQPIIINNQEDLNNFLQQKLTKKSERKLFDLPQVPQPNTL